MSRIALPGESEVRSALWLLDGGNFLLLAGGGVSGSEGTLDSRDNDDALLESLLGGAYTAYSASSSFRAGICRWI